MKKGNAIASSMLLPVGYKANLNTYFEKNNGVINFIENRLFFLINKFIEIKNHECFFIDIT